MTYPQGPPPGDPTAWSPTAQGPPPAPPPPPGQPGWGPPSPDAPAPDPKGKSTRRLRLGDPISIVLIVIIVVALAAAALLGGELYARNRADQIVTAATECVVQDKASTSFGPRPFLLQHWTGHYTDITIKTAGNQIRDAKGMKAEISIRDVRLKGDADSQGTIGALDARISWTNEGIKETVAGAIPLLGSFITGVTTNPSEGTIELQGALGSVTAKPQVVGDGLGLQVVSLTGLGFTLPRETVQPALDVFTTQLTDNYPLGIHADSVQVTDSGVIAQFSTRNAEIPKGEQDPCFAGL